MRRRFVGCLLGSAIGDAVGMPIENVPKSAIQRQLSLPLAGYYDPLPEAANFGLSRGMYTDDTQAIRTIARCIADRAEVDVQSIAQALNAWLHHRALDEDPRNPGPTTREALRLFAENGNVSDCGLASNSCGAATRVVPVALFCALRADAADILSRVEETARITHTGECAVDGARIVGQSIVAALRGAKIPIDVTGQSAKCNLMREALQKVSSAVTRGALPDVLVQELGSGTEAHRVVPMAIFHLLRSDYHFEQSLNDGLNTIHPAGSDMDSILCIVGAISGTLYPREVLESPLATGVEKREEIIAEAERLFDVASAEPRS